jgi:hypothetical protein
MSHVIDRQDRHVRLLRFQLQSQLLLDCGEQRRRRVRVIRWATRRLRHISPSEQPV